MSIGPVGGFAPLVPPTTTPAAAGASPANGTQFANQVARGIDALQQVQATSDGLATKAATGDLTDVHDYMVAATKASLATELTVAVRNKAVDAFNEIMRMPL